MIVHFRRGQAQEEREPVTWVLDAMHSDVGGELQRVLDKALLNKSKVREDITPKEVRTMIQGVDVHFVHTCLGPTLLWFGTNNRIKYKSLMGKFLPGDTVLIIPAVGKNGEWVKGKARPNRSTKVVERPTAYYFKLVAREEPRVRRR